MKIAVPVSEGKLCSHFGGCSEVAIVEAEPESRKILGTTVLPMPPHEPGRFPKWLSEQGANVVIAGGMGERAQKIFDHAGIQVVLGAPVESPQALATAWLEGRLQSGPNGCHHDGHEHHDHHHHGSDHHTCDHHHD